MFVYTNLNQEVEMDLDNRNAREEIKENLDALRNSRMPRCGYPEPTADYMEWSDPSEEQVQQAIARVRALGKAENPFCR